MRETGTILRRRGNESGTGMAGGEPAVPETPLDWMALAACKDEDPEIFFHEAGGSDAAKRVCRRCPVRDQCLDFGGEDPYGIWGGISRKDRRGRKSPKSPGKLGRAAGGIR